MYYFIRIFYFIIMGIPFRFLSRLNTKNKIYFMYFPEYFILRYNYLYFGNPRFLKNAVRNLRFSNNELN
jgi:hypothetical protein